MISILVTATISLSLLACGSNNAGESETIPNITEAKTTSTAAEAEEISTTVEAKNTSAATEAEAGQNETTTENESTETTEMITKDSTETPATAEVSKEAENNIFLLFPMRISISTDLAIVITWTYMEPEMAMKM